MRCRYYFVYVLLVLVFLQALIFAKVSLTVSASASGNDLKIEDVEESIGDQSDYPVEEKAEDDQKTEEPEEDPADDLFEAKENDQPEKQHEIITYIEAESDIEALNYIIQQIADIDDLNGVIGLYVISIVIGFGLDCAICLAGMAVGAFSRIFAVSISYFEGKGV